VKIVQISVGALPPVFDDWGGAIQRRVGAISEALAALDHEVHVVSPGRRDEFATRGGLSVRYIATRLPSPWNRAEFVARAMRHVRRINGSPDIVHFHSEPEGAVLATGLRCATVLSYDNYLFGGRRQAALLPAYRRALKVFDLLLPCSEYCRAESGRLWRFDGRPPMEVLYNGVDLEQFAPDAKAAELERRRLGLKGKTVLYLGRVCEQKGVHVLLNAYRRVRERVPTANLVIAGPIEQFGDREAAAEQHWRQRLREGGAQYIGAVEDGRLRGLYNAADVLVLPTIRLEMFGMVAAEALACGTPVVASDHGGIPEVVGERSGELFPVGDAASLAGALSRLLEDEELRRQKAQAARESVRRFSWATIASRLDTLYGTVRHP
jgi:glycosyltransferase involved in cell wall biosynthesis